MPTLKASIPHKLGAEEAKKRITNLIGDVRTKYSSMATDVQESWNGPNANFGFKAMGFPISGTMRVEADVVHVEVNLPFAALPFKSKIEEQITSQARHLLA
jgi:hypothetical protein